MASVQITDSDRKDPRFVLLGKKLGTTKFDARARMIELWAYCTENHTYEMRADIIDVCAEFEGFSKIILSDEINFAVQLGNGLIRIDGTKGRIEWLKKIRKGAKEGGKSRIKTASRDSRGRLVKSPAPAGEPPPAQSSAISTSIAIASSIVLKEKENIYSYAREAAPPGTEPPRFKSEEISLCENALQDTLKAFEIERPVLPHERMLIVQLMGQYGAKSVAYALYGMQFEQGTDTFDPKKHVALSRILDREKFEKALNRGAAEMAKVKRAKEREEQRAVMQKIQAEVAL